MPGFSSTARWPADSITSRGTRPIRSSRNAGTFGGSVRGTHAAWRSSHERPSRRASDSVYCGTCTTLNVCGAPIGVTMSPTSLPSVAR
jgi:hypothetical protein